MTAADTGALIEIIDAASDRWATLEGNHGHRTREARDRCMAGECDGDTVPNGYSFARHVPGRVEYISEAILAAGFVRPTDPADLEDRRVRAVEDVLAGALIDTDEVRDWRDWRSGQTLAEALVAAVVGIS